MERMGLGLIGCGGIARTAHLTAMAQLVERVVLRATTDADPAAAQAAAASWVPSISPISPRAGPQRYRGEVGRRGERRWAGTRGAGACDHDGGACGAGLTAAATP